MANPAQQLIEPEDPLVYYRVHAGHWTYSGHSMVDGRFSTIYLNTPPNALGASAREDYFHRYTPASVFSTVFKDVFPYPTERAHLFFNTLARGHFTRAYHGGQDITIVKIRTTEALPTVEEYVADLSWTHPDNGDTYVGSAGDSLMLQGAVGREYVLDPALLEEIQVARYHTNDYRIFTSNNAAAFAATEECITDTDRYMLDPPVQPPASSAPAVRRDYLGTMRLRQSSPNSFLVVTRLQPAPVTEVYWNRITVGDCVRPPGKVIMPKGRTT
jgi:hypothetical protein